MVILVFLFGAFLFGLNGISVAKNKNIRKLTGFLYGFSMGPLGLIIVALLNPDSNGNFDQTKILHESEKNLNNDTYKIYLVGKYNVEKNEVLDAFICGGRLFRSGDEAIKFAHEIHQRREMWVG